MTHSIGDPDHIGVHNELTSDVQTAATEMGVDVDLPPQRNLGDRGHTTDHNKLQAALDKIASEGVPPATDSLVQGTPTQGINANSSPAQLLVKKKDGTRMTAHVLPGNTGDLGARLVISDDVELTGKLRDKLTAIAVPDDFTDDVATLLPKTLIEYADSISVARIPHPSAEYAVTLPPGVLQGVLIAAGGSGGSTSSSGAAYSGGGGAGGVIGRNRTPIVIPGEPNTSATFTFTVASTTPKGTAKAATMRDALNGQPTLIKDGNGLVIASAVGGGHGGGKSEDNSFLGPSQGGSGGGGADASQLYWRNGLGVPGQGNDGGHSGTLSGGGGGASLPGNETNGGAGVDLIELLDLDPNDQGTQGLASMFTDNGYVGGGGGGYPNGLGGTGGGGDAWYAGGSDPRDGQDHTGAGGGGSYGTNGVAAGGAGMAVLLAPA